MTIHTDRDSIAIAFTKSRDKGNGDLSRIFRQTAQCLTCLVYAISASKFVWCPLWAAYPFPCLILARVAMSTSIFAQWSALIFTSQDTISRWKMHLVIFLGYSIARVSMWWTISILFQIRFYFTTDFEKRCWKLFTVSSKLAYHSWISWRFQYWRLLQYSGCQWPIFIRRPVLESSRKTWHKFFKKDM